MYLPVLRFRRSTTRLLLKMKSDYACASTQISRLSSVLKSNNSRMKTFTATVNSQDFIGSRTIGDVVVTFNLHFKNGCSFRTSLIIIHNE